MDWILVGLAGFLGGMLNAVAGGGSFITLPVLIYVGLPAISANATGTAALLPGYIASAWRFRKDIEFPAKLNFAVIFLISVLGGSLGAAILLLTSEQLFFALIPWLILFATAAFVIGPRLLNKCNALKNNAVEKTSHVQSSNSPMQVTVSCIALFAVCLYGGYFNGGLGIILLAVLGLLGQTNLHGMNGLKNLISTILTTVAVAVYFVGGTIAEGHFWLLSIAAAIGGYVGAAFAYRISQGVLRGFIVLVGCLMSIAFFLQ